MSNIIMAKQKTKVVNRPRTGLRGAPMNNFKALKQYFHIDVERKVIGDSFKSYVNKNYSKGDAQCVMANPDFMLNMYSHFGAIAFWINSKLQIDETVQVYVEALRKYIDELIESGKEILKRNKIEAKNAPPVITPHQRLMNKITVTVVENLYVLEDQWNAGEKTSLDIYNSFKLHGLTGPAVEPVKAIIQRQLDDYEGAYKKTDPQLVEGYSHIDRSEIARRIKELNHMLVDLDRVKSASKAVRKPSIKKPKSIDKQIAKVQYKKEDAEFKIVSLSPAQIIGRRRLYAFNTKTRALIEYFTYDVNGFEISGTSIKNFDKENSRTVKLRKPEQFIPIIHAKSPKQIDAEWDKLTTKTSVPNGRLNSDTVLLRVLDK